MKRTLLALSLFLIALPAPARSQPAKLAEWTLSNAENLYMSPSQTVFAVRGYRGLVELDTNGSGLRTWVGDFEDVAVSPDGDLFALFAYSMNEPGNIKKLAPDGGVIKEWSPKVTPTDRHVYPMGIALGPDGILYVVDEGNRRVVKFSTEGEYLGHWTTVSSGSGPADPTRIVVTEDGTVILGEFSDAGYGRIKKYTPGGSRIAVWTDVFPDGKSFYPGDIAVDRWGNIYVADSIHEYVIVYSETGRMLGYYKAFDGTYNLLGIAVDGLGNTYVADGGVIRVFAPFGPAFESVQDAAVMLHVRGAEDVEDPCSGAPRSVEDIDTDGQGDPADGGSYYVYVLGSPEMYIGSQSAGINGFQLGIEYHKTGGNSKQGIRIHGWTQCAALDFPQENWPGVGSGNTITWPIGECQEDEIATAGFFYLSAYSPSRMSVIPYPPTGQVKVANCLGAEMSAQAPLSPIRLGWVSLEEAGGCNPLLEPCYGPTPVEPATWGQLKVRFGGEERGGKPVSQE